jgi:hypothetical protein
MRRLSLIAMVLLAGCGEVDRGGGAVPGHTAGSCAAVLRWHGTLYVGVRLRGLRLKPAGRLGLGAAPGCSDTIVNGKPADSSPDRPRAVWRIRGVPPAAAVMVREERRTAYVSPRCLHADRCRASIGLNRWEHRRGDV